MSHLEPYKHPILHKSPEGLNIIPELVAFMQDQGLANLDALLEYSIPELLEMEGFGFRCLRSLTKLLRQYNCRHLLREFPRDDRYK